MDNRTYVIGHVNPDTDAIASAMGYAWLLRERDGLDAIAARAGPTNPQTNWALNRLGLESPLLLADASPRFSTVAHRLDTTSPERPLREAWAIANRTWGIAPIVDEQGMPYGLVTGYSVFNYLGSSIGPAPARDSVTIGEILNIPSKEVCDQDVPKFKDTSRIRDSLHRILRQERTEFWVVNEQGHYVGICRQRELLKPPRMRLILVDHNEPNQALPALDEAELVEVLDHHRLDNPSTHRPIRFTIDVVGSTSTLVSERIEEAGLSAPPPLAGMLLAGLISDTLALNSPTSTDRDEVAAQRLSRWAFVGNGPLAGETMDTFQVDLLQSGTQLANQQPQEVIRSDQKLYEAGDTKFSISQVEVTNLVEMDESFKPYLGALEEFNESNGLNFSMLMVTDIVNRSSHLILTAPPPELADLPYIRVNGHVYRAEGVVSRKLQLLPVILGLLES
ncbi:MAG: DHH family phosphoesterase [Anaerolineales bacterium]|nr:DHH family phosphoesterase [Anaerolineales bacterium]